MLNGIWTKTCSLCRGIVCVAPWSRIWIGLGSGWVLLAAYQQFFAQLGCSTPVISAVWCVSGIAWAWAWSSLSQRPTGSMSLGSMPAASMSAGATEPTGLETGATSENASRSNEIQILIAWIRKLGLPGFLLLAVAMGPQVWKLHDSLLSSALTDTTLGSPWLVFGYATLWASLMLTIPVWCVARFAMLPGSRQAVGQTRPSALYLVCLACGLWAALSWNGGHLYAASLVAGFVVTAAFTAKTLSLSASALPGNGVREKRGFRLGTFLETAQEGTGVAEMGSQIMPSSRRALGDVTTQEVIRTSLITAACGGLIVWLSHVIGLLLVTTLFTYTAIAAGALLGIGLGLHFSNVSAKTLRKLQFWAPFSMVLGLFLATAGFTFVAYRLVTLTGSVSRVWMLQSFRDLFVVGLTLPVGFVWGLFSGALSSSAGLRSENSKRSGLLRIWSPESHLAASVVLALIGGVLIQAVMIPLGGMSLTAYGLLILITLILLVDAWQNAELPRSLPQRASLTALGVAAICLACSTSGIRPEVASRLLFSTSVFLAEKEGVPRSQLQFLDDSRLRLTESNEHGTISVWKSAVSRFQIRENGIPVGVLSTNGAIAPQPSAEVLTSLIPMALHEQPREVAVLGIGAGVPLFTCLGSLETNVTLIESDSKLLSVVKRLTEGTDWDWIWKESRLQHVGIDPAIWVGGKGQLYDVVVSNTDQSALLRSTGLFTREFYQRAARRLNAEGIFCQRFAFHDFGPQPLQSLSATIRSVFAHVMAVETGPGEMAFIATNSEKGLIRPELAERTQALFVKDAMAGIGWDWSVLLTLGAYDAEHLDEIEAAGRPALHTTTINTATNGRFCTQLPPEVMRWGHKAAEVGQVLHPSTGKILNWMGEVANQEDLLRRLAEVRGQQELLGNYTDQYWAYRSQVRKQVSTRPMSLIQKVNHEKGKGGLHPEDKRRLRYFQQLSKAIHTKSPKEIERLETFTSPYDPLVSLFVHQELAEIAARVPGSNPSLELEHRLHTLFFTSSNDKSVRNALSALRLILDKPEAVPDDSDRFDVLNTVLQALQYRWEARTTAASGNALEVARDVEENIVLGEKALRLMTELATSAGVSEADCRARQLVIERKLLQPLRTYRLRLEPHVARQKMKARETELESDLPTDDELQFPGAEKETAEKATPEKR